MNRQHDAFGLTLATASPEAAAAWDRTVFAFLAHGAATPEHLAATLDADPGFGLAHLAKGFFLLLLGRRELVETAREARATAAAIHARGDACARERDYALALDAYLAGDLALSADRLDVALAARPADALALKLVHAIRFVLGDSPGMLRSIEGVIDAYGPDHAAHAYVKGCHAFALEEAGDYRGAEARGRDAVLRAADDAWGVHAVAHVFDMQGRAREGVAWLRGQPETWAHCNNFRYHVWWHLALFHLDRGETAEVLRLYDEEVRAEHTDDYRDISNAASLLARLEIEGVDVGTRWEEMAAICEGRTDDGCVVFADLHYMLALGAGDRDAEARRLLRRMQADARAKDTTMEAVTARAGLPAAEGLLSFAHGDYHAAFGALASARPAMQSVGGSHAQRDVFERLTVEAALRAGRLEDARDLLEDRARRRGALDGYAERRLARIGALGDERAAAL